MNILHAYKLSEASDSLRTELDDLTTLTQFLSVLKLKMLNPNSKVILYTDEYTLNAYKEFGVEIPYDEVNTSVLSTYPENEIVNNVYWASPKLWVMKHQTEPFIMVDTDIVVHVPLEDKLLSDFVFLHTETPTPYPFPSLIESEYEWTESELTSFMNTLPMNCAVVGFNNMELLKKYTDKYFEFVIGNKGNLITDDKKVTEHIHEYGPQITLEQWLLSSLTYQSDVEAVSLLNSISFPQIFNHQMYNVSYDEMLSELNGTLFHLWGGKAFYEKGEYEKWNMLKTGVIQAIVEIIQEGDFPQTYLDILEKLEDYCREIPEND